MPHEGCVGGRGILLSGVLSRHWFIDMHLRIENLWSDKHLIFMTLFLWRHCIVVASK